MSDIYDDTKLFFFCQDRTGLNRMRKLKICHIIDLLLREKKILQEKIDAINTKKAEKV